LLILVLLGCRPSTTRSISDEDRSAIRAAHAERAQALIKGDAKAAAAVATETGVILPPGLPSREGRRALEEWFSQGRVNSIEFEPTVIEGEGGWAYDRGEFRVVPPDGKERRGKYLWVWRREPNVGWRVHVAMWDWYQEPS
jgi:ketosteroid isomerase-like protein